MSPPGARGPVDDDRIRSVPLVAAVRAAASGSHLESTLRDVVEAAVRHVDACYGALGVLTPDGRRLDRFVVAGMDDADRERIGRLPTGHGLLGLLVAEPAVLHLDDLGSHPASIGLPLGHPPMRSFLGVPVRVREEVFGNLYLTEKRSGGPFTPADAEAAQALAAVAGLAIENARLVERAEDRRRWSQAATELATALLSGADPDEVLRSVVTRVSALVDADIAGILTPSEDDDQTLTIVAAAGAVGNEVEGVRVPAAGPAVGSAQRLGLPRVVEDISAHPVVGRRAAVVVELTAGYGPALLVPLGHGPDGGLLAALRTTGRPPFCPEQLDLLASFAAQASVALELARAQQRARRLQLQADRDRIARDLHDHVVQRIFATALSLDRLGRSLEPVHPEIATRLAARVDDLDGTMAEIRAAIFELQEEDEAGDGALRRQLADVVRQLTEETPLQGDLRIRGPVDGLPRDLAPDIVAVVRELVTNVVRHAAATRVTVRVDVGTAVAVTVTDDGIGLPAITVRSGLANLTERATRRGGRLVTSGGPTGTEVCWSVPHPLHR